MICLFPILGGSLKIALSFFTGASSEAPIGAVELVESPYSEQSELDSARVSPEDKTFSSPSSFAHKTTAQNEPTLHKNLVVEPAAANNSGMKCFFF